jgi:hypothetical protein
MQRRHTLSCILPLKSLFVCPSLSALAAIIKERVISLKDVAIMEGDAMAVDA